jgi:hypothetical protein
LELRKRIVDCHARKAFYSTPKDLDRMKNLIISFPEFLGEKADSIYLFKVNNLMKKQPHPLLTTISTQVTSPSAASG